MSQPVGLGYWMTVPSALFRVGASYCFAAANTLEPAIPDSPTFDRTRCILRAGQEVVESFPAQECLLA